MALFLLLVLGVLVSTVTVSAQIDDDLLKIVGENVTLNCSTSETITDIEKGIVEWRHKDPYVLVFKDGKPYNEDQDPRFEGRVEMADTGFKHGNLSIRLKNVTKTDSGIYQCFFIRPRQKRDADNTPLATHNLVVVDKPVSGGHESEGPDGGAGGAAPGHPLVGGVVVGGGVLFAVVGLVVVMVGSVVYNHIKKSQNQYSNANKY